MGFGNIKFTLVFFYCVLLTWFLYHVKANVILEATAESSFSYNTSAPDGPPYWGDLNPAWRVCGTGQSQSPIDIVDRNAVNSPSIGYLNLNYKPATAVLTTGHAVEVEWTGDAGGITINNVDYKLVGCHWHTPSEHTIDGIRRDVELHVVHTNAQGDIAVIGILYGLGNSDSFLARLLPNITSAGPNPSNLGVVDPFWIDLQDRNYYRYIGSLTTPPCSEGVTWTLYKFVRGVSRVQIDALRAAIKDGITIGNARPIQLLNGRTVLYVGPTFSI